MKSVYSQYLFGKGVLVNSELSENAFDARFALANRFNVSITKGAELAHEKLIDFVADMLGEFVPDAFYRGFPQSVRKLSKDQLLFDQLMHYARTYGAGDFSEAGHSLFEEQFERLALNEETEIRRFVILTEEEAEQLILGYVEDLLKSTRPLSRGQYDLVRSYVEDYGYMPKYCACKDTAIKLLVDTRNYKFASFLALSDVVKLVDYINYELYGNDNIKKLNLCNRERKLIAKVIDEIFENGYRNVRDCFEKKAVWCGLLHHIHYQPKSAEAEKFVALMRGKENHSVYSEFERAMAVKDIEKAVKCLLDGKGSGALLRNLNYILSRCESEEEVELVMSSLDTDNAIILAQLIMQYSRYAGNSSRNFKFVRHNLLSVHKETPEECDRRRSALSPERVKTLMQLMYTKLEDVLASRLGKVYIAPEMYNIALPLQESTANSGFGILPRGSKIHLEEGKKVRAFTYWEKVDDIDLSVIGITEDGLEEEFSWRTMYDKQSLEICYSGDQTSGYDGGTEYFDLDIDLFREAYPHLKYLVFCDNVFYGPNFSNCLCKAGYMLREDMNSGEAYEPKTVKSSFAVNCESTFAYLFGIDLENRDFVWLNMSRDSYAAVAGATPMSFLTDYFHATSVLNVGKMFEMLATEVVDSVEDADVVVGDGDYAVADGVELIRSCDFERMMALLNTKM